MTYIGYGKSDLDLVVQEAAVLQGRVVLLDQFPDRGSFYRSGSCTSAGPDQKWNAKSKGIYFEAGRGAQRSGSKTTKIEEPGIGQSD